MHQTTGPARGEVAGGRASAALARSITRTSSPVSYLIARLLVDKDLVDDCLRAYAYFRWADDIIDVTAQAAAERRAFIKRQKALIDAAYRNERPRDLTPEEAMIVDLIAHDRGANSQLQSFIRNFMSVLEFDGHRKGRPLTSAELTWYSHCLGKAVTNAIQYFIGNNHAYPDDEARYLAATAAHITHMLRDMRGDLEEGFINVPEEWLAAHNSGPDTGDCRRLDLAGAPFRAWVRGQVDRARDYFGQGQRYLDELAVLRCKIAGYWYCASFECVLDAIERDGYLLRPQYDASRRWWTWLRLAGLAVSLSLRHVLSRGWRGAWDSKADTAFEPNVARQ